MFLAALVLTLSALAQQPAEPPAPEMATLKAGLGDCSADFTVTDADGAPVYGATITVSVRYGFMNLRRTDLEVGTNARGRARIEGLPAKARPLTYTIRRDAKGAIVQQDVSTLCTGVYDVSLKSDFKEPPR